MVEKVPNSFLQSDPLSASLHPRWCFSTPLYLSFPSEARLKVLHHCTQSTWWPLINSGVRTRSLRSIKGSSSQGGNLHEFLLVIRQKQPFSYKLHSKTAVTYGQIIISVKNSEEEMNEIVSSNRTTGWKSIKLKKPDFPGDLPQACVHLTNHIF